MDDIIKSQIQMDLKCGITFKTIAQIAEYSQKHIKRFQRNL